MCNTVLAVAAKCYHTGTPELIDVDCGKLLTRSASEFSLIAPAPYQHKSSSAILSAAVLMYLHMLTMIFTTPVAP